MRFLNRVFSSIFEGLARKNMTYPKYNDKGAEVKKVQLKLVEVLGKDILSQHGADGHYGNETVAAIKAFQGTIGVQETGILDQVTYYRLFGPIPALEGVKDITEQQLRKIAPNAPKTLSDIVYALNVAMRQYQINTKARQAAFLAQLIHESGSFNYVQEIASGAAYEGRKDLGNTHRGDGVKYKGRGYIQITGRANYLECGIALGIDLVNVPAMLEQPKYAALSAGWFWQSRSLNQIADKPSDWRSPSQNYTPFQYITYRINGGQNGATDRLKYYNRALKVL